MGRTHRFMNHSETAADSVPGHDVRVLSAAQLAEQRDALDRQGKHLVFTNGCFDLLHVGHTRYLQAARQLGDALAIGLNADASVRALKGAGRPLNNEADRAEVLAALRCVDFVVVFAESRATRLLAEVRPHVYVKGGDYRLDTLNPEERAVLEWAGSRIEFVPMVPGRSTTSLIERMQDAETAPASAQMLSSGA